MRMRSEKVRLLGRYGGAFAVGDAFAGFKRRGFARQRQFGSFFTGDCLAVYFPREKQIQVGALVSRLHDVSFVGQRSKRVFGGEAGNVVRGLNGLRDGFV